MALKHIKNIMASFNVAAKKQQLHNNNMLTKTGKKKENACFNANRNRTNLTISIFTVKQLGASHCCSNDCDVNCADL